MGAPVRVHVSECEGFGEVVLVRVRDAPYTRQHSDDARQAGGRQ